MNHAALPGNGLGFRNIVLRVRQAFTGRRLQNTPSAALVWKKEYGTGQVRLQRCFLIVARQNSTFPNEQVRITAGKFVPVRCASACHALADKKKVGVGDGLVVELRFAARCGEALQGSGEFLERL